MPINWTPETLAKARTRLAAVTQEIAEERAIADALSTHADEHRATAWCLESEQAALAKAIAEAEEALTCGE